ncbi:MAG: PACE efflux transporter [Azoarcus sp.]|jgi:uncharacterized membrane protein|nr:PACE efflux transporter [Azoarcus sp.]
MRSPRDRLRQAMLFEAGGLILVSPLFAWANGLPLIPSAGLLAVLSLIALLWNMVFNTGFDRLEARLSGRRADRRPLWPRIFHACFFEGGLLVLTLPVVMLWTGLGWWPALLADIGLALAYALYALLFHFLYDRWFPI